MTDTNISYPTIGVVTISFNQGAYIKRCIDSVLKQKYENISYVVVDAGSTDDTLHILRGISDSRLRWISERDGGPADGLNKGFKMVGGDILCYLNADDEYLPRAFENVIAGFVRTPSADIIYGDAVQIDQTGNLVRYLLATNWSLRAYALGFCNVIQPSTFFRRSAFERTSGFNVANPVIWDTELLIDMGMSGCRFECIRKTLSAFRIHSESLTGTRRLQKEYLAERARLKHKVVGHAPPLQLECETLLCKVRKYALSPALFANAMLLRVNYRPRVKLFS